MVLSRIKRQKLIAKWREELPLWTEMVEGTTVLEGAELEAIFPEARILAERSIGIVKPYVAYSS